MSLVELVNSCLEEARTQGAPAETATLTPADCDWICEQLGRKPTREEWAEAGYGFVGERHVGE